MNRARIRVILLALALLAAPSAQARRERAAGVVLDRIAYYRAQTWHWQELMGLARTPSSRAAWRRTDTRFRSRVLQGWRHRAALVWTWARRPSFQRAWLCIHEGEGAWHSNTGNGYYGGLQMDLEFQHSYAPRFLLRRGTADRWTPLEQMWVAERARRSGRGFYPWPNTARACGLI